MAVPPFMFDFLCRTAREQGGGRASAAGHPDLLVFAAQLNSALGPDAASRLLIMDDSRQVAAWYDCAGKLEAIFETRSVFQELGYGLDVIDIRGRYEAGKSSSILIARTSLRPV